MKEKRGKTLKGRAELCESISSNCISEDVACQEVAGLRAAHVAVGRKALVSKVRLYGLQLPFSKTKIGSLT